MKRPAVALLPVAFAAIIAGQQPPGTPRIQVLIITGQNGNHDWRGVTPYLRKALEDTGRFEVRITEEFRGAGPETLAPYDLVVLNYGDGRRPELRWGERADNALLDFVRSGKGFVIYHSSTTAFEGWPEFEKLCGGNWRPNNGRHAAAHPFMVNVEDSGHPITRGLKKSFPQVKDELYSNLRWQPAGAYHVLATAWDDHSAYTWLKQPLPGPGANEPMLWVLHYGKGRVFGDVLGHDIPAVQSPAFVVTFTRGAEWAASGEVTLPVPPEMRP